MSKTFSQLVAEAKPGATIDLGSAGYALTPDPAAPRAQLLGQKPLTIQGEGATIEVPHSAAKSRPAITIRGSGVKLLGDVTVICADEPRRDDLESQHGCELAGAHDCTVGWKFANHQGTGLYMGKNSQVPSDPAHTNWSQRITVLPTFASTNAGRGHIELQAIIDATIDRPQMDTCGAGHSSIGFEANGHDWGCHNVTIKGPRYRGHMGFALSLGSLATSQPAYNCTNVVLTDGVSDEPFTIHIDGGKQRMGSVVISHCRGGGVMNTPQVKASHVDHLFIVEYHQRTSFAGSPFELTDCPNAVTSVA